MRNTKTLYTLALFGLLFLFNSCKKEYEGIESIDDAKIQAYIKTNNLSMTPDPSGFYYQVVSPGTGEQLVDSTTIFYEFSLKSLSGEVYQNVSAINTNSNRVGYVSPAAFRVALLKIKRGGKVKVILPSHLAFGKNGSGNIPSNEVIVAEISVYPQATQVEVDDAKIQAYLTAKGITAVKHSSGVYYQIKTPGTGTDVIDSHSTITVGYIGRFLDGTVFDSNSGYTESLSQFVEGWIKIFPLFKAGTKARIFIPSGLGYGIPGKGTFIPSNAVLDFDIEITTVTN